MATRISSVPCSHFVSWPLKNIQSAVAAIGQFVKKRSSNLEKGSMRVRGRGFAFHRFPWGDCDITVYLSWSFSCATQLLFSCWPVIVFSLFTAVAYCPVADCGWPENLIVLTGF
jgi:hypothetical protein